MKIEKWKLIIPEPSAVLMRLEFKIMKMGISLTPPAHPKTCHQRLPTMLRIKTLNPITSCSKASGVFSSRYRYPASSRESHFHRALRWDSSPVVTPFVRFGTSLTFSYFTISIRLYHLLWKRVKNFLFCSSSFFWAVHHICQIHNFTETIFGKMFLFVN